MSYDSDGTSALRCAGAGPGVKSLHRPRRPSPVEGIPPQVFLIAQTPYGYLHHRSQRIADELQDWGVPLTYVEESGGWRPYLTRRRKGLPRALGRSMKYHLSALANHHLPVSRVTGVRGRPDIVEMPLSLATNRFDSASLERLTASLYREALAHEVFPRRDPRLRSVALVNSPLWGMVLRRGDFDRIVYDCIDDVSLYAGLSSVSRFLEYEQKLIEVCDAAVATAASLEQHVRGLDVRIPITRIPNGVDVEWFQAAAAEQPVAGDVDTLPAPVVGYVGTISGWLNIGLAAEVARLLPGLTFLFVGPEDPWIDLEPLKLLPNVRFIGRIPYDDVPAVISACRVCWIPFSSGRIVERTNPIKLFEYFALGKPVVSTWMPELEVYRRRGLLGIGATAEELAAAIQRALAEEDDRVALRRVRVAREHSWDRLISTLYQVLRGGSPSTHSVKPST